MPSHPFRDRRVSLSPSNHEGELPVWEGFTFVGDSTASVACDAWPIYPSSPSAMHRQGMLPPDIGFTLSEAEVGDRLQIVALNCGGANARLMGMGLMPGTCLEVISKTASGSVVVAIGEHRLGLGADMAHQITVVPAPATSSQAMTQRYRPSESSTRTIDMNTQTPSALVRLRDVEIGARLRVVGYEPTARAYKRKLLAMGLTPGVELTVTRHAPLGDPTQIEVRGFSLSLRKAEADALQVERVESTEVSGGGQNA